jgi:hypothetical protein
VTHGKPLFPHRVGIGSITPKRCDSRHNVLLFCGCSGDCSSYGVI